MSLRALPAFLEPCIEGLVEAITVFEEILETQEVLRGALGNNALTLPL